MNNASDCPWLARVSALCDNELPADQILMVRTHVNTCRQCAQFADVFAPEEHISSSMGANVKTHAFYVEQSLSVRVLLGIFGCVLLGIAVMNFVNGSVDDAAMHDVRHLGIWQASLGTAVVALSVSFRFSLFVASLATAFFSLTFAATIFDIVKGHSGPWADFTHLVELLVLLLLMFLALPKLKFWVYTRRSIQ